MLDKIITIFESDDKEALTLGVSQLVAHYDYDRKDYISMIKTVDIVSSILLQNIKLEIPALADSTQDLIDMGGIKKSYTIYFELGNILVTGLLTEKINQRTLGEDEFTHSINENFVFSMGDRRISFWSIYENILKNEIVAIQQDLYRVHNHFITAQLGIMNYHNKILNLLKTSTATSNKDKPLLKIAIEFQILWELASYYGEDIYHIYFDQNKIDKFSSLRDAARHWKQFQASLSTGEDNKNVITKV